MDDSSISRLTKPALFVIAVLWLHYFWSLVPSWRFGEYYEYGFMVPPLAFAFAWQRVGLMAGVEARPWQPGKRWDLLMTVGWLLLALTMIPLRMIETGDPLWRPPLHLHGIAVTAVTHLLLARIKGWRFSIFLMPVTLFAWSAVPYLGQIEAALVRNLTGIVISLSREGFLLFGQPVEQIGERLILGGEVVDVTDGCSGIRSFQSLLMAALFFGELLGLKAGWRVMMVAVAVGIAILTNTGRAIYLASVRFSRGPEAFEAVHDSAGHVAFGLAALVMLVTAKLFTGTWFTPRNRKRVLVRRSAAGPELPPPPAA
jgi:exosortase